MPSNKPPKLPESITWQSDSHARAKRSLTWHIGLVVIAVLLMAYAIYIQSLTTIITFGLIIVLVYFLGLQTPHTVTCRIDKTGVKVGNMFYDYKVIKKFWLNYNQTTKTLNFETTAYLNNSIVVQLGHQDPLLVKLMLEQYISEDLERDQNLSDALGKLLKI